MVSTTQRQRDAPDTRRKEPSVLVVLVAHEGVPWLKECLRGVARQDHPRLGIVAVDTGSTDGSRELLEQALGPERVISMGREVALPEAVQAGLKVEAAERADYLLVLHDDTALEPDAVSRMVEAAERIEGVGIVGPKVLDWEDPRVLLDVGQSTDGFGYPYTPLEEDEIDHGQYDRVREVLFVSSAAMLVSSAAWKRVGALDERLAPYHEDLDFCWRARLAGFRVLMSPRARARHRGATVRGERKGSRGDRRRLYAERASLAAMLKNYGLLTLLWILPLYVVQSFAKAVVWTVSRRFEEAWQIVAAWAWNLAHLPSTIRRRIRAQSVRSVPDRAVRRYMAPAGFRMRRWADTAGTLLRRGDAETREEQRPVEEEEDLVLPTLGARTLSLARAHPVATAWVGVAVLALLAYRHLWGGAALTGGALPTFPGAPSDFFGELLSGVRTTGLGGTDPGSPALGMVGVLSGVPFVGTAVAQKVLLMGLPPLAGLSMYRLVLHRTARGRVPAIAAAACYGLSSLVLWAFSEGRIATLVALAVLPAVVDRLDRGFADRRPERPVRFVVEAGLILAIGASFFPAIALAVGVMGAVWLLTPGRRGQVRGVELALGLAAVATALAFPIVVAAVAEGGASLHSTIGRPDVAALLRLSPGPAPGSWSIGWFLPAAALLSFTLVDRNHRRTAVRLALSSLAGVVLAWLSAARYLPEPLSNPSAYLAVAAVADCALIGLGAASALQMGRRSFGYRQVAGIGLGVVVASGVALQALAAGIGGWAVGENKEPPAWPLVASAHPPTGPGFRVLWLGAMRGDPFTSPGGDPIAERSAGGSGIRYGLTEAEGSTMLDAGRGAAGDGYAYLERSLSQILTGNTTHGGALLGPLGVAYVVAAPGDLPEDVGLRLDAQVDLDLIPAGGLVIYKNERAMPVAAVTAQHEYATAAAGTGLLPVASLPAFDGRVLHEAPGGYAGESGGGTALLASQFASEWRLNGGGRTEEPTRSFGWGTAFESPAGSVEVTYSLQWVRDVEVAVLAVLWLAAIWITRKPARR